MPTENECRARERAAFVAGGTADVHDARQEYCEWLDYQAGQRYPDVPEEPATLPLAAEIKAVCEAWNVWSQDGGRFDTLDFAMEDLEIKAKEAGYDV